VGYAEVLADEQAITPVGILERVYAWYATQGLTVRRLLTDNGGNYRSDVLAACCRRLYAFNSDVLTHRRLGVGGAAAC